MVATTGASKPSRRKFWLVLGLFFVPLVVAFALYYGSDWRPTRATNRGELVTPPRPLPQLTLPTLEGETTAPEFLQKKWSLVYIGGGNCDTRCREALVAMRQVRLALNADMERVQRVFLYTTPCCDSQYLHEQHAGLLAASLESETGRVLLNTFADVIKSSPEQAGRIYIVDPLGNLMMSYARNAPAKDLLEDMKKLLRLSHIG